MGNRRTQVIHSWLSALALAALAGASRGDTPPAQGQTPGQPTGSLFTAQTGSLFSPQSGSLFTDVRARKVGDTITILVQESATATSSAATKTSKNDSVSFGGVKGALSGLLQPLGVKHSLLGPLDVTTKSSIDGQGQTNRSGSLITKITATVKEVLPNGNLKIEGNRIVGVNQEKQKVVISGVVRPQDVNPDNTVSSIALADMTVQYDGKGPVGDRQRRGLLSTIFGWLF